MINQKIKKYLRSHKKIAQLIEALPFLGPTLIGFFVFVLTPVVTAFGYSFTYWDLLTPPKWIGLDNYQFLVQSSLFWKVIKNTFWYIIMYVPAALILPLFAAILLKTRMCFQRTKSFSLRLTQLKTLVKR